MKRKKHGPAPEQAETDEGAGSSADAWLEAQIDETMKDFDDLRLPPEVLEAMREELGAFLRTNPAMVSLGRRLRPRGPVEASGVVSDEQTEEVGAQGAAVGDRRAKR